MHLGLQRHASFICPSHISRHFLWVVLYSSMSQTWLVCPRFYLINIWSLLYFILLHFSLLCHLVFPECFWPLRYPVQHPCHQKCCQLSLTVHFNREISFATSTKFSTGLPAQVIPTVFFPDQTSSFHQSIVFHIFRLKPSRNANYQTMQKHLLSLW